MANWLEQVDVTLANTEEVSFDTLQELLETGNSLPQKTGIRVCLQPLKLYSNLTFHAIVEFKVRILVSCFAQSSLFPQQLRKQSVSSVALWLWVNGGKKRQNCAFKHGKKHTCDLYSASLKRKKRSFGI